MNKVLATKIVNIASHAANFYVRKNPFLKGHLDDLIGEAAFQLLKYCQDKDITLSTASEKKLARCVASKSLLYFHSEQLSNLDLRTKDEDSTSEWDSLQSSPDFDPEEAYFFKEGLLQCDEDQIHFIKARLIEDKSDTEIRKEQNWNRCELEEHKQEIKLIFNKY